MKTLRLIALLCIVFGFTANNANAQFRDDFSSSTLDPAWTVVQTWPGGVPRHYSSSPGNHYSLTDNPGYLRFLLDPMTHPEGFQNNYESYISYYYYDAGLEIHRTFSGDKWRFEAKGIFNLPYVNGRGFVLRLYFGTGGVGTYFVSIYRGADVHWNGVFMNLKKKTGPAYDQNTELTTYQPIGPWYYGDHSYPPPTPQYYRVERDGGVLTVYWSDDGAVWNTAFSYDLGTALDGLEQRVVIAGICWFLPNDSYADWDYVSVESTECTAPDAPVANDDAITYDGLQHTASASVPPGSSIVWYDAPIGGNITTEPSGTNYGTYTAWAESVNVAGCKSASRTPVTVTINPAPLIIKANDATKYCGQMNPAFSATYIGFVNGENESVLGGILNLSSTANEDTGIGTYSITPSGLTSVNYEITFKPGELAINSVSIDASASSKPVPVGSSSITLSAKVQGASSIPVPYMKVWFSIENGNNQITNYPAVFTAADGSGVATLTIIGLTSIVDVFKVTAAAGSGCGNAATSIAYLAVYDPSGGFVTGGGWINSPYGALVGTNLTGKANFGFVSKYKKGSNVPDGNTEFQFHEGNLNFSSSSYDLGSLVIAGNRAIYKGVGTINGAGSYSFMVSAVDGDVAGGVGNDKFRIKIWNKTYGAIVYDNNLGKDENDVPSTVLGGGSIVIHRADDKTTKSIQMAETNKSTEMTEFGVKAYPNPFTDKLYFDLQLKTDSKVRLEIFDINGTKLATVYDDNVAASDRYLFEYIPVNLTSGLLIYRLTLNGQVFAGKVVYRK
jgi:MBG domain (YGX type)/Ig-like domain CHU_C associated